MDNWLNYKSVNRSVCIFANPYLYLSDTKTVIKPTSPIHVLEYDYYSFGIVKYKIVDYESYMNANNFNSNLIKFIHKYVIKSTKLLDGDNLIHDDSIIPDGINKFLLLK